MGVAKKMSDHICRTCGGKFDCGYGDPCSSKNEQIDCHLCYNDYMAMVEEEVESAYIRDLKVNADIDFNSKLFSDFN